MKKLALFALSISIAACSHDKKSEPTSPASPVGTSTAMSGTPEEDPMIDPTLPSWSPKSCVQYHTAVVRYVGCESEDKAKRETARQDYDAKLKSWQDMHDLPQGAIEEVGKKCETSRDELKAMTSASCPGTTVQPTKPVAASDQAKIPNS